MYCLAVGTAWSPVCRCVHLSLPLFLVVPFALFCFGMAIRDRREHAKLKSGPSPAKPKEKEARAVHGARTQIFELGEAACLLAAGEPAWPLSSIRAKEEYNALIAGAERQELKLLPPRDSQAQEYNIEWERRRGIGESTTPQGASQVPAKVPALDWSPRLAFSGLSGWAHWSSGELASI